MSGYVRDIVIKKRWQGDDVTIVLKPMGFKDLLGVTKYLDANGKANIPVTALPEVLGAMKPYTKALSGLKTNDAADVTLDELYDSAYFMGLLTEVLPEWLAKATPENPPSPSA